MQTPVGCWAFLVCAGGCGGRVVHAGSYLVVWLGFAMPVAGLLTCPHTRLMRRPAARKQLARAKEGSLVL